MLEINILELVRSMLQELMKSMLTTVLVINLYLPDYFDNNEIIDEGNQIVIGRYLSHWQGHVDDAKSKGISCLTSFSPNSITSASTVIFGSRSTRTKK